MCPPANLVPQRQYAVFPKRLDGLGGLESGFIISFALDPHSIFKHLLIFPSSCYMQSEDVHKERGFTECFILHFISLNFGYTLGELTSEVTCIDA